jgi:hypothetical protein
MSRLATKHALASPHSRACNHQQDIISTNRCAYWQLLQHHCGKGPRHADMQVRPRTYHHQPVLHPPSTPVPPILSCRLGQSVDPQHPLLTLPGIAQEGVVGRDVVQPPCRAQPQTHKVMQAVPERCCRHPACRLQPLLCCVEVGWEWLFTAPDGWMDGFTLLHCPTDRQTEELHVRVTPQGCNHTARQGLHTQPGKLVSRADQLKESAVAPIDRCYTCCSDKHRSDPDRARHMED